MARGRLSGPLYFISLAASIGPLFFGVQFLQQGQSIIEQYAFPIVHTLTDRKAALSYFAVAGLRNISIGLATLAFVLLQDRRGAGVMQAAMAFSIIGDGIIVYREGASYSQAASHIGPGSLFAVLSLVMLLGGGGSSPAGKGKAKAK